MIGILDRVKTLEPLRTKRVDTLPHQHSELILRHTLYGLCIILESFTIIIITKKHTKKPHPPTPISVFLIPTGFLPFN